MKTLNVVREQGDHWMITGLTTGEPIEILRRIRYPETEWPEIGSIEGAKEMHEALYDIWQTSDALEAESKRRGGLMFHTPFGDFVTVGVHVFPAEEADAARAAHKLQKKREAEGDKIEVEVMSSKGFGPKRMKEITDRYGHRFDDWPKELARDYWDAYKEGVERRRDADG